MSVSVGTAQWIGQRDRQEDSLSYGVGPDGRYLLVLADGMGGHVGGDIASRLASSVALEALLSPYDTIPEALQRAVDQANSAIADYVETSPESEGMGTTLVCAVVENGKLWWSSVGDSHIYLFRRDDAKKLNADHSMMPVLQKMVAEGEITAEQAAADPKRNALRSAITGEPISLIDLPKRPFDLQDGDTILICSDGVDSIPDPSSLSEIISSDRDSSTIANDLLDAVKAIGKPRQDNTSVIVARMGQGPRAQAFSTETAATVETAGTRGRTVLVGIALALAVTSVWFFVSSWRAKADLAAITGERAALVEQLELSGAAVQGEREAQAALAGIADAISSGSEPRDTLAPFLQPEVPAPARAIAQAFVDLLADRQALSDLVADRQAVADDSARQLNDIINALESDDVVSSLNALGGDLDDGPTGSLVRAIAHHLQRTGDELANAAAEKAVLSEQLLLESDRLEAFRNAVLHNTLVDFVQQFPDSGEAQIARLFLEIQAGQQVDPTDVNAPDNN